MPAQNQPERTSGGQPAYLTGLRLLALFCLAVLLVATSVFVYATFIERSSAPAVVDQSADSDRGTALDPPRQLTDFTLTSQSGAPLRLSDLRGKYVLLFFGYSHCPDVCPTTLSDFVLAKRGLSTLASQVRFVFVSVDGARDTPPVLTRFLSSFDPSFVGLQGDDVTLGQIGKEYGLFYQREQVAGTSQPYMVTHSSSSYLIDRAGRLRMVYHFGTPPKLIASDIADLYAHE